MLSFTGIYNVIMLFCILPILQRGAGKLKKKRVGGGKGGKRKRKIGDDNDDDDKEWTMHSRGAGF